MLSGSATSKLTRNIKFDWPSWWPWWCDCPPNISIQSSEGRVAHGVWNAFTKLLRIDRAFPHVSRYPLSLGGWIFINTLFNNHKIEREAGVPYCYVGGRKSTNCWYSARVCGRSKGSVEGNFEGTFKESIIRSVLQCTDPLHSKVDIIPRSQVYFLWSDQWRNDESCMKNIDYFLSLSPPRNHDTLLEAIKLVSNLICNMANVAALSFLPVGSPLATVILCWYLWRSVRSILNKNQARYLFGVE